MESVVAGRFQIEREAGAGAMGRVYRAIDVTNRQPVALKVIQAVTEHAMRRFAREVSALVGLDHPGIVRYVAHGQTQDGHAYLAMEWLDGEILDDRLERGPLGLAETLALGHALADALAVAHTKGLIHRNLKPANIFLVDGDVARPKLLDFGLARDTTATFGLTATGDLLGTPLYMAPEQAACELDVDARCDVYALGAVLYRALAGRPPLLAPNLVGLLAKIVLEEPKPLATLRSDIPRSVGKLVTRMLAKQRADRPADGTAARVALDAAAANVSIEVATPQVVRAREQRVVSILLASKRGSNEHSADATLGSAGGVLALADGSTMMVVAGPESAGDLAARAVRYGLALRSDDAGVTVATGRALLSGPTPMGEVIERAAALLADATGKLRTDAETAALLEGRFELAHDETSAYVLGEKAELDSVRTLLGKPTRCIGRDRELAAIEGYFVECIAESSARAVVVLADAGVGKSRLANEIQQRLAKREEGPEILVARCESITSASPFAAIAAMLRRHPEQQVADPNAREFLDELLGLRAANPSERLLAARDNPVLMFEQIRAAVIHWVEHVCARRPVLLVVEDAHWADESSALLVDAALAALAERPFMVLALARPEFRDRKLWASRRPHELRLDPLSRRSSERLVRDALGDRATDQLVQDILSRADGNALFLEELVRAAANNAGRELPVGVLGTLQLRFDGLRPGVRTVLRVASVFGERVTRAGLAALLPDTSDLDSSLAVLLAEELFRPAAHGYAFRHALTREAAYALLVDDDRVLAHALAGRWLATQPEHDPSVIANHFEAAHLDEDAAHWHAIAAERALARNDLNGAVGHAKRAERSLVDPIRLGQLDVLVAEAELGLGNLGVAHERGLRAASRLEPGTPVWFIAAGLVITAAGQLGDNELVRDWTERVLAFEPQDEASMSDYVLALARGASQLAWSEYPQLARRALRRASDTATGRTLTPTATGRLEFARAYDWLLDGRPQDSIDHMFEIATSYANVGAVRDSIQMRMLGHMVGFFVGQNETAERGLEQCVVEATAIGATFIANWALYEIGMSRMMRGLRKEAESTFAAVSGSFKDQPLFQIGLALMSSWNYVAQDDVESLERDLALIIHLGDRRYRAGLDGFRAYALVARGDRARGCELAVSALARIQNHEGAASADLELSGAAAALLAIVRADHAELAAQLAIHRAVLDKLALGFKDPEKRRLFLDTPWNRRVLSL